VGYDELFWLLSTNGNVLAITNNKTTTRSQTFTYTTDGLNRLAKAVSGTTWGANFSYDAWGNLYSATGVTGTTYVAMTVNQTGINNKNQFTQGGYGYDAAGNVLNDGLASGCGTSGYQWNAEGQMSCANGTTYAYDGDGLRVKKSSGTLYWAGGVAESDASGNLTSEYVFFGGKRVARRDVATGNVYYYLSDHLGSSNVVTNATGTIQNESDFYPFGGERQITNNLSNQHFKFTGKERDTESGLDDFGARYYSSGMGRFMSPDWSDRVEPVPYAKIGNPQSLNLYAYAQNNAITLRDADGHSMDADGYTSLAAWRDAGFLGLDQNAAVSNFNAHVLNEINGQMGQMENAAAQSVPGAGTQNSLTGEIRNVPTALDFSNWTSPTGSNDRWCDTGGCGTYNAPRNEGLGDTHHGQDYLGTVGQNIFAIHDGTLTYIGFAYPGNNTLRSMDFKAPGGITFQELYIQPGANMKIGTFVVKGQVIGTMQNVQDRVGTRVPPHIHVGIKIGGERVNPSYFIQPQPFLAPQ
jgi:RHS repeat-associated protein